MPTLICPRCLSQSDMRLDIADGETLTCPTCDEPSRVPDIEALIECWSVVLPWLRQCKAIAPKAEK